MQLLNVTNAPIYLPWNTSPLPFGDVLGGITCTAANPGVVTSVGYTPTNGDIVSLSFTAGGSMPTGLTAGTSYYVVNASGQTFQVSATKGGAGINTTGGTGSNLILHLLSAQVDGTTQPFNSTNSCIVVNMSGGTLVLQGASDANPTAGYPTGPGSYSTIVSVPTLSMRLANLNYDWIRVSTAGTLQLLQN